MKFLLFQIYAPLVSWGDIAVGGERQSSRYPSKSAIIGLVSAALGIKREEEERLNSLASTLGVAVQLYAGGSVLKDFHTAQVPRSKSKITYRTRKEEVMGLDEKDNAILSKREYRCDSLSVIAINVKDDCEKFLLDEISEALKRPHFHLYFGRKSCVPALPLAPQIVEAPNLRTAFRTFSVEFPLPILTSDCDWERRVFERYPQNTLFDEDVSYFWEEGVVVEFQPLQRVERYDQPISRKRWQFSSRKEYMAIEKKAEAKSVH